MKPKTFFFLFSILISLIVFVVFGFVTAVIPNPFFTRMFPVAFLDYIFLTLTTLMLGAYTGLHFYMGEKVKVCSNKNSYAAAGGAFSSFLAFSCPVCNILLVSLFGATALITYFQPFQPVLGVLGVVILGTAIYFKVKRLK